jgi:hypothetical protein
MNTAVVDDEGGLTQGDAMLGASGLLFLFSTFLTWFTIAEMSSGRTRDSDAVTGWNVGFLWGPLPFLIVLGMLIWAGLRVHAKRLPLPLEFPSLYLVGGAGATLLIGIKLIVGHDAADPYNFSARSSQGIRVALVAVIGVASGAYMKFREATVDQTLDPSLA